MITTQRQKQMLKAKEALWALKYTGLMTEQPMGISDARWIAMLKSVASEATR